MPPKDRFFFLTLYHNPLVGLAVLSGVILMSERKNTLILTGRELAMLPDAHSCVAFNHLTSPPAAPDVIFPKPHNSSASWQPRVHTVK